MPVSVPKGTTIIEAAKQAGVLVPHYCYHPSLPSPGGLPDVPGGGGEGAQADAGVRHHGGRGPGGARQQRQPAKKAREGVLEFLLINHPLDCPICDQAGECELQDYVFQEGRAGTRYARVRQALQSGRGLRPRRALRAQPLHPLHPLRAVHGRRGRRRRCSTCRERGDRAYIGIDRGAAARSSLGRQRGGPLPGRVAALEGLPAQGAGLGSRQDRERLPRLHPGLQHHDRHPGRRGGPAPAAPQPRRQPALHLRLRPDELPLDEPGRPDRGAAGARGRPRMSPPTGTPRSTGWASSSVARPGRR